MWIDRLYNEANNKTEAKSVVLASVIIGLLFGHDENWAVKAETLELAKSLNGKNNDPALSAASLTLWELVSEAAMETE